MMSVGNDIVDLSEANIERAADPKFYSKFITDAELHLYQPGTIPFYQFVWLLWTVKESVYKYLSRHNEDMVFAPVRIPVSDIAMTGMLPLSSEFIVTKGMNGHQVTAQAGWADSVVHTRSLVTKNFIATFAARESEFEHMYWGLDRIGSTHPTVQSAMVTKLAVEKLRELIPDTELDIHVLRNLKRLPMVFVDHMAMPFMPISFSHQGNFISYAFISE